MSLSNSRHTPFFVQFCDSDAITLIRVLLEQQANSCSVRVLSGACVFLDDSCGSPKKFRRWAILPIFIDLFTFENSVKRLAGFRSALLRK